MNDAVLQMWSRDMKIMQIKKLSKLINQLNTSSPAKIHRITPLKKVVGNEKRIIERSLPVSTDDEKSDLNDWGSDFEEASTPPSSRNPANKKISSNHSSIISNSAVSRTP